MLRVFCVPIICHSFALNLASFSRLILQFSLLQLLFLNFILLFICLCSPHLSNRIYVLKFVSFFVYLCCVIDGGVNLFHTQMFFIRNWVVERWLKIHAYFTYVLQKSINNQTEMFKHLLVWLVAFFCCCCSLSFMISISNGRWRHRHMQKKNKQKNKLNDTTFIFPSSCYWFASFKLWRN